MDKKTFETFRKLGKFEIQNLTKDQPFATGVGVSVKKYKITIEEVEESPEVIGNRLQALYLEEENERTKRTIRNYAKSNDYKIK